MFKSKSRKHKRFNGKMQRRGLFGPCFLYSDPVNPFTGIPQYTSRSYFDLTQIHSKTVSPRLKSEARPCNPIKFYDRLFFVSVARDTVQSALLPFPWKPALSGALVIRHAFRLRRTGLFACESEDDHRGNKRNHVVHVLRQIGRAHV